MFYLTAADRTSLRDVRSRVLGGGTSQRAGPKRPRVIAFGGDMRAGRVSSGFTAATGNGSDNYGTGSVQFYTPEGVQDGAPVEFKNPYPVTIAQHAGVVVSYSSGLVVGASCLPLPGSL